MNNHIHLLLETSNDPPGNIIHTAHTSYARYFNKRYDLVGHVFQGRFGAKMIKDAAHFLYVSRYIHRNPIEANLVKRPEEYQWSSYSTYLKLKKSPLITTEKILQYYGDDSQNHYQKYVESTLDY